MKGLRDDPVNRLIQESVLYVLESIESDPNPYSGKSSPIFRERREKLLLFINGLNPVALANLWSARAAASWAAAGVGNNSPPHGKNRSS